LYLLILVSPCLFTTKMTSRQSHRSKPAEGDRSCTRKEVCYILILTMEKPIKPVSPDVKHRRQNPLEKCYFCFEQFKTFRQDCGRRLL